MMKRILFPGLLILIFQLIITEGAEQPTIVVLATGGTIAGQGAQSTQAQYEPARTPVEELLRAVPEIQSLAQVRGEQFCQIASQDMTTGLWVQLACRVNELLAGEVVDGIVITHGTDTMEETAYLLSLTTASQKPVVLTGAMRPPTSLSADGALNLYNAIAVAVSPSSHNQGVLVVMNDVIHAAREVTKRNTTNVATFQSPIYGPLGEVFYGEVNYYRQQMRPDQNVSHFIVRQDSDLPRVDILYSYAGFNPDLVDFVATSGTRGIVFAGTGNGNPNQQTIARLAAAREAGIAVVRASRPGTGRVTLGAEVDDSRWGFVVADNLSPQKSRILLMLALLQTDEPEELQKLFFLY
jgi:L-asparaginase